MRVDRADLLAALVVLLWAAVYALKAISAHYSLGTNAYDLSVFDYALENIVSGRGGHVPFFGFSIFSQHFVPILYLLALPYAIFRSPVFLIVCQIIAAGMAGWLFYFASRRLGLERPLALLLLMVFLFARRTHGALTSFFYPESLQPALALGMVLAWLTDRRSTFWVVMILLLMTKEDAPLYVGAFGAVQLFLSPARRRESVATIAVAALWLLLAVGAAIPASRAADGLARVNPLLQARFGVEGGSGIAVLAGRVASWHSVSRVGDLLLTAGLLPVLGFEWLAIAVPGIAVNLAAAPDAMQSDLVAHYFWAVLPWLFVAGAVGLVRLYRGYPVAARVWVSLLVLGTLLNTPFTQRFSLWSYTASSRETIRQLRSLPIARGTVVLAQSNLVPHVRHVDAIYTLGEGLTPPGVPDLVLLAREGDPWPLTLDDVDETVKKYRGDRAYEEISSGPLFGFRRR